MFRIFKFYALEELQYIYNIHYFTVAAKGESKKLFYRTIIKRGLGIAILIVCFYYFGIASLLCGCAATSWIILFVNIYLVSKSIKYKFSSQLKDLFPVTFLSIVCFIFSYMVTHTIDFNIYIKGILALILYILLYAMFSFFFKIKAFKLLMEFVKEYLNKNK